VVLLLVQHAPQENMLLPRDRPLVQIVLQGNIVVKALLVALVVELGNIHQLMGQ